MSARLSGMNLSIKSALWSIDDNLKKSKNKMPLVEFEIPPTGVNMCNKVWQAVRGAGNIFIKLNRGAIDFVRYIIDVVMVDTHFNVPDRDNTAESMAIWREGCDSIATMARTRMDNSLKRAEMYRVVAILAKARGHGVTGEEAWMKAMEFPVIRRSGRAVAGGNTMGRRVRWEPKFRWRGISLGGPTVPYDARERLRIMEVEMMMEGGLRDPNAGFTWYPLKIDRRDEARMKNRGTDWGRADYGMPVQVPAVPEDYILPGNANPAAVHLGEMIDDYEGGDDIDAGEWAVVAAETLGRDVAREGA